MSKTSVATSDLAMVFSDLNDRIKSAAGFRSDARVARETSRYIIRQCAESLADYIVTSGSPVATKATVLTAISELKAPNADVRATWRAIAKDLETVLNIRARLART